MVYVDAYYFNKIKIVEFNSTVGRFIGYTDIGIRNFADYWNINVTDFLNQERNELERYCKHNSQLYLDSILDKTGKDSKCHNTWYYLNVYFEI